MTFDGLPAMVIVMISLMKKQANIILILQITSLGKTIYTVGHILAVCQSTNFGFL